MTFPDSLQLPASDQKRIAASIKQQSYGSSLDGAVDDALNKVKEAWQNAGYFQVKVSGEPTVLTSNAVSERVALAIHVDEGQQYRLGKITFQHNRALSNAQALRSLFPINDGDVFSREKVVKGLNNLRSAYAGLGYINFTSVPSTSFDDEQQTISLDIDVDEGKQFYVSRYNILGLDEPTIQELLNDFPVKPGEVANERLMGQFLLSHTAALSRCGCANRYLDERAGTVALTLDFRPCAAQ